MSTELSELLVVVFGASSAADAWLRSPVPTLRGPTPRSLIGEGRRADVVAVLAGLASGAHA